VAGRHRYTGVGTPRVADLRVTAFCFGNRTARARESEKVTARLAMVTASLPRVAVSLLIR